ncbi:uncharacterized protein LOC129566801 isoform X2 [Sitodiplosis mosellana]|uniref:uncharacterized protein LOC129566801 isoform X2 n=1 Tax=Sitodiplosis mosellana TaxID=263140 RepID=UPI002444E903|nr:uncharacterized protein LOC129566801 isoform X2 [Sitodiplosis mosellana]
MTALNILLTQGIVIPLWVFVFGGIVFGSKNLGASYSGFAMTILFLLVSFTIGALIQHFYPRSVGFAMQSISWLFFVYIFGYDVYLIVYYWNLFTFELFVFTLDLYFVGFIIPIFAYIFGWIVAMVFEEEYESRWTVANKALGENMFSVNLIMSITTYFPQTESLKFLFSLVAIMIPIPLFAHLIFNRVKEWLKTKCSPEVHSENESRKSIEITRF